MNAKLSGHCYCGAVRFEIDGSSDWVGHCHCESCRRASGSVMTTFAGFRLEQVRFTGTRPAEFATADGVTRNFCARCGSPVAYRNADTPGEIQLHLGLFDDLEALSPVDHSFREEKASWLHIDDQLPDSGWVKPDPA